MESPIRARFVRDSFHSLSTELGTDLSRGGIVRIALSLSLSWGDGRWIDAQTASPERSRRLVRRHALHRLRRRTHRGAGIDRGARRAVGVRAPAANGGRADDGMACSPSLPDRFGAD